MYLEEVKTVEYTGEQETYDLKVPIYHNFILSNDVVTHNSGKSSLSELLAGYLDPTFRLDQESHKRVVFNQKQFFDAIDNSSVGQAIIFDEFVTAGLAQEANTSNQSALIQKMTTIRKKRLFLILVIPSFFMLRMYFAIFRARCLIHCYTPDGIERGSFIFFSYKRKKNLYVKGKKMFSMSAEKGNFVGNFIDTQGKFIDMDIYDKKKEETIRDLTDSKKDVKGNPKTLHRLTQLKAGLVLSLQELYTISRSPSISFFKSKYDWIPFGKRQLCDVMRLDALKLKQDCMQSTDEFMVKESDKDLKISSED